MNELVVIDLIHEEYQTSHEYHYAIVGSLGAVEFHFFKDKPEIGGLEIHYRNCPSYQNGGPHFGDCYLLNAPCWHDGSSLWAMEYWCPNFKEFGKEWLWNKLEQHYKEIFEDLEK
jgi:hypothetical protein